jgi:hypothetical protein
MKRLAFLLLLGGCSAPPPLPQRPHQDRALQLVWDHTLGATDAPPQIEWREDVCTKSTKKDAAVVHDGECYAGLFLRGDRALIAWRGSYTKSAFAHELIHAWQWSKGVDDPKHKVKKDWELETAANEALEGEGF